VLFVNDNIWNCESFVGIKDLLSSLDDFKDAIKERSYDPSTKEYNFFHGVQAILQQHALIGYHITRQIDDASIRTKGLQLLDFNAHWQRISDVLLDNGINVDDAEQSFRAVYEGSHGTRQGLVCFFAPIWPKSGLKYGGWDKCARYYGGEIAENAFYGRPDILEALGNTGTPYVVKVSLPYAHINSLDRNVAIEIITMILVNYHFKSNYIPFYTLHFDKAIPSSQIISVERIK